MRKCHSHVFIVFPSCAVNSIMCILVPSRLVDTQRKTSKSKTQKLRPQPQFLWGHNSRLLQVRIRLTLIVVLTLFTAEFWNLKRKLMIM